MKTKDSELPELMVMRLLEIVGHCEKREHGQPTRPKEGSTEGGNHSQTPVHSIEVQTSASGEHRREGAVLYSIST